MPNPSDNELITQVNDFFVEHIETLHSIRNQIDAELEAAHRFQMQINHVEDNF